MLNDRLDQVVPRQVLAPGLWKLQRKPSSTIRVESLEVLVTRLPMSGILVTTSSDGKVPYTSQFLADHFLTRQAVKLERNINVSEKGED